MPQFVEFHSQWQGRCFVCEKVYQPYRTDRLFCERCLGKFQKKTRIKTNFFEDVSDELSSFFATVLPEVKDIPEEEDLLKKYRDVFLADRLGGINRKPRELLKKVFRSELLLPCGQPSLFESESLTEYSGLGSVWVLDMSPYLWSGTHKDIRSWAVLSAAMEHGIKHLALWTAGNAGFSLAKLVHRWNAMMPEEEHKQVYCFVDSSAPPEIVVAMRALRCSVAPIATGTGAILSNDHLFNVVNALSQGRVKTESYWQVTDGWDGVGPFIYSLLAQQALYLLQSKLKGEDFDLYIIVPVGTGNLLVGFIRAMERVTELGGRRAKMVGALPSGDNVITPLLPGGGKQNGSSRMRSDPPEAPKLAGFYSPLSPCLWHLLQSKSFGDIGAVEFIEVDRSSQVEAASHVLNPSHTMIAAEPSALVAFGALKDLSQIIAGNGRDRSKSAVMVVNSGFGLMEIKEQKFYTESIFAFR